MHILPSMSFSLHFFSDLLLSYKNSTLLGILWPNNSAIIFGYTRETSGCQNRLPMALSRLTYTSRLNNVPRWFLGKATKFGGHTSNGLSELGVSGGEGGGFVVGGSKASPGLSRVKALFGYAKLCLTTRCWRNILFVSGTDEVVRRYSNTVALCTSWMFWPGAGQSVRK